MKENGKILIVDDDEEVCITLKDILIYEDYDVKYVIDGFSALDAAGKETFDAIIMDIKMPGIDGIETFRRLKSICKSPVILLSAFAVDEIIKKALKEGVLAVLNKPVSMDKLLNTIKTI